MTIGPSLVTIRPEYVKYDLQATLGPSSFSSTRQIQKRISLRAVIVAFWIFNNCVCTIRRLGENTFSSIRDHPTPQPDPSLLSQQVRRKGFRYFRPLRPNQNQRSGNIRTELLKIPFQQVINLACLTKTSYQIVIHKVLMIKSRNKLKTMPGYFFQTGEHIKQILQMQHI